MHTKKFLILVNLLEKDYSTKISEIESKIPTISGLATNSTLNAVGNKIPDVSNLVKKKQIMTQKLVKLKRRLMIIIMTNILPLHNLII